MLSSAPILATLAQVATDGKVDLAGVVDRTQVEEVIRQWRQNGNSPWKEPLLRTTFAARAVLGQAHHALRAGLASTTTCTRR